MKTKSLFSELEEDRKNYLKSVPDQWTGEDYLELKDNLKSLWTKSAKWKTLIGFIKDNFMPVCKEFETLFSAPSTAPTPAPPTPAPAPPTPAPAPAPAPTPAPPTPAPAPAPTPAPPTPAPAPAPAPTPAPPTPAPAPAPTPAPPTPAPASTPVPPTPRQSTPVITTPLRSTVAPSHQPISTPLYSDAVAGRATKMEIITKAKLHFDNTTGRLSQQPDTRLNIDEHGLEFRYETMFNLPHTPTCSPPASPFPPRHASVPYLNSQALVSTPSPPPPTQRRRSVTLADNPNPLGIFGQSRVDNCLSPAPTPQPPCVNTSELQDIHVMDVDKGPRGMTAKKNIVEVVLEKQKVDKDKGKDTDEESDDNGSVYGTSKALKKTRFEKKDKKRQKDKERIRKRKGKEIGKERPSRDDPESEEGVNRPDKAPSPPPPNQLSLKAPPSPPPSSTPPSILSTSLPVAAALNKQFCSIEIDRAITEANASEEGEVSH